MSKSTVLDFEWNSYYAKNRVKGLFLPPKIITFAVFAKSVHDVFLKLYLTAGIKNGLKWPFEFFKNGTFLGAQKCKNTKICIRFFGNYMW